MTITLPWFKRQHRNAIQMSLDLNVSYYHFLCLMVNTDVCLPVDVQVVEKTKQIKKKIIKKQVPTSCDGFCFIFFKMFELAI